MANSPPMPPPGSMPHLGTPSASASATVPASTPPVLSNGASAHGTLPAPVLGGGAPLAQTPQSQETQVVGGYPVPRPKKGNNKEGTPQAASTAADFAKLGEDMFGAFGPTTPLAQPPASRGMAPGGPQAASTAADFAKLGEDLFGALGPTTTPLAQPPGSRGMVPGTIAGRSRGMSEGLNRAGTARLGETSTREGMQPYTEASPALGGNATSTPPAYNSAMPFGFPIDEQGLSSPGPAFSSAQPSGTSRERPVLSIMSTGARYDAADANRYDAPEVGPGPAAPGFSLGMSPALPPPPGASPSLASPPVVSPGLGLPPGASVPPPAAPTPVASESVAPPPSYQAPLKQQATQGWNAMPDLTPPVNSMPERTQPVYADGIAERLQGGQMQQPLLDAPVVVDQVEPSSQYPEGFSAFSGFMPTPGFHLGRWSYICVDPTGLRLRRTIKYLKSEKTGGALNFGETFIVCERGEEEGMQWLCLADGRGWAFERTNRRRAAEIVFEELGDYSVGTHYMVSPTVGAAVALRPAPFIVKGRAPTSILPGSLVTVTQKARVICQGKMSKDLPRTFLNVLYDIGADGASEGWMPEHIDESGHQRMLVDFRFEPCKNCWISIVSKSKESKFLWPTPGFSGASMAKGKLEAGDIFPAEESCLVSGITFFRLPDGGWVADKTEKGQKMLDVVEREDHCWQYTCVDKEGTAIRRAPTRSQNMNTGKTLKNRQRVCASEIVRFSDGDAFLHIEPPNDGWVPLTKLGGQKKMQPLQAISPKAPMKAAPPRPPVPIGPQTPKAPATAPMFNGTAQAPKVPATAPPVFYAQQPQGPAQQQAFVGSPAAMPAGHMAVHKFSVGIGGGADFGIGAAGQSTAPHQLPGPPPGAASFVINAVARPPPQDMPQAMPQAAHAGGRDFGIYHR